MKTVFSVNPKPTSKIVQPREVVSLLLESVTVVNYYSFKHDMITKIIGIKFVVFPQYFHDKK